MSIFTPEPPSKSLPDVEHIAAKLHGLWIAAKQAEGIFSSKVRPNDPSEEEKMVPYDQLSDAAKAIPCKQVLDVYACIDALWLDEQKGK